MPRLLRISEAIADRDLDLAEAIASDLVHEATCPGRRLPCEKCGLAFEWYGELDHHRRMSGHELQAAA